MSADQNITHAVIEAKGESSNGIYARAIARDDAPRAALRAAKLKRIDAYTDFDATEIHASANLIDSQVCAEKVAALREARKAAVLAARPADVLRIGDELRVAEVDAEITAGRAQSSAEAHAAAGEKLRAANAAVDAAARAVLDLELTELAAKFTAAFDHAMKLGAKLQALSTQNRLTTPIPLLENIVLPKAVQTALDRIPQRDWRTIPLNELRDGTAGTDARAQRLAELGEAGD